MKKVIVAFAISLSVILQANAGSVESKLVFIQINVEAGDSNAVLIDFEADPVGSPACATDAKGRMITLLETEAGKAVLSLALTAKASGDILKVNGTGECIGNVEKISWVRIL